MGGKACIKGTRVTVGMILTQIGNGKALVDLLDEYPYLSEDDVMEAIRYAAWTVDAKEIAILSV
jgi:uncharacterized protein (DUF433 family)